MVDCQKAFNNLKTALISDLTFTHYNPYKEIYVVSYASNLGLGAVLLYKEKEGQLKAVHHVSRTLLLAEINYSQIEKERLGLIFAIKKFHKYIHGREFILQTDHHLLLSIFSSKKGILTHLVTKMGNHLVKSN